LNSLSPVKSKAGQEFKPKLIKFFQMEAESKEGNIVIKLDFHRLIVLIELPRLLGFAHRIDESGRWLLS
jgi:hypothetical protein